MRRMADFVAGAMVAWIAMCALYIVKYELLLPPRLECGVRTDDGCMVYTDTTRLKRYVEGRAGRGRIERQEHLP